MIEELRYTGENPNQLIMRKVNEIVEELNRLSGIQVVVPSVDEALRALGEGDNVQEIEVKKNDIGRPVLGNLIPGAGRE